MSYDFEIRFDDLYSKKIDTESIKKYLLNLEDISMSEDYFFEYKVKKYNLYASIYLEFIENLNISDDTTIILAEDAVNCIRLAIPYAHLYHDERDQFYINLGVGIARHLGWMLHDEQQDTYISV